MDIKIVAMQIKPVKAGVDIKYSIELDSASNITDNNLKYGISLVNADLKYKDVYAKGFNDDCETTYNVNSNKVGDAVYETSSSYSDYTSWYEGRSHMSNSDWPFFARGGGFNSEWNAGLFNFQYTEGYNVDNVSFRPVIAVDKIL